MTTSIQHKHSLALSLTAVTVIAMLLVVPLMAQAQILIDPDEISGGAGAQGLSGSGLRSLLVDITNFLLFLAGILVVIFLLWGGITYLTAGADEEKRGAAKQRMISGVVGAAIIIGIWVIIRTLINVISDPETPLSLVQWFLG